MGEVSVGEVTTPKPEENILLREDGFVATFKAGVTYTDKLGTMIHLLQLEERTPFVIGDLMSDMARQYGEKAYEDLAKATGYSVGTLKNKERINYQIPPENRRDGIKSWVWQEVAPVQDAEEQADLIARAGEGEFKDRDALRRAKNGQAPASNEEKRNCPTCGSRVPVSRLS